MNSRYETILFDLDGTLTDSYEGITKSVQYALKSMDIEENDKAVLKSFIGPPLKEQFMKVYGLNDSQAAFAIHKYRERFSVSGIYENRLYDGVPELLAALKERGKRLAIASAKPLVFVKEVLRYFDIDKFFDVIQGSEINGTRTDKKELIEYTLNVLDSSDRQSTVMVGDRFYDAEGAAKAGVSFVGVLYGFGSYDEFKDYPCFALANTVHELIDILS